MLAIVLSILGSWQDNEYMYIYVADCRYLTDRGLSETKYDFSSKTQINGGSDSFTRCSTYSSSNLPVIDNCIFTYANYDVLNRDSNDVVFPQAPQEGATIAGLMTSIDFSMVLAEVLKMLPTILIVLIGLIALMKAIKLLYSIFRNA